jgi:type I restriction enzyme S subunit
MVNGANQFPDGWKMTTFGEATKPVQKRVNPQDYPDLPYIGMENVEAHTMRLLGTVPAKEMKSTADSFSVGDVLYGRLRPYLNKVYLADFDGLCSTEFIIFRKVSHLNSKYLQYFLNSWDFVQFSNSLNAGDRPRVKFEQLADYLFPIPPLPEQERIVAKIEELFTQLEAGQTALAKVQAGLRRYKASVLKAAVSGKLVSGSSGVAEGELPNGWRLLKAEEICDFITKGTTPKASKLFSGNGDIPFIKVYNLTFDGSLDFSVNPTFVSKETHTGELARSKALPNDVLMNIVGPPLGKVSIVPNTYPEWNMNQAIARFRALNDCEPKYLAIVLMSDKTLSWATKRAKATAGQFNLTLEICRELPISLPPLEQQRRIVAEVERRLSVARQVETAVEAALVRASRLRQAVLRSAFEGRLVNGL